MQGKPTQLILKGLSQVTMLPESFQLHSC